MGSLGVGSGTKNFGRQVEVCKSPEDFGYGFVTSSNQKYVDQAIEVPSCRRQQRNRTFKIQPAKSTTVENSKERELKSVEIANFILRNYTESNLLH